ncbi:MAG: DUF3084 domain-containing protein [Candidatus Riflebacteria bacterium]|nr:DUF3084 domain-containing protein [Candidatus Riflebacteria bacterium]
MFQIFVLMAISGLIAYLGDRLGTYAGKKRLSIFGMRPKNTAVIFAVSTGVLITSITLITAMILSENVRIALFSVQKLSEERESLFKEKTNLTKEKANLTNDIIKLNADKKLLNTAVQSLQDRIRIKGNELVVLRKDEPLAAVVVKGSQPKVKVLSELTDFFSRLSSEAKSRGLIVNDEKKFFDENRENLEKMAEMISSSTEEIVVGAIAGENISIGEPFGKVKFRIGSNRLVFSKGDEIASIGIDGKIERTEITRVLLDFMEEIRHEVVIRGMIGDPLTDRFGVFSIEAALSFYDLASQIKKIGKRVNLVAVVDADTYSAGPLNLSFKIEEEE